MGLIGTVPKIHGQVKLCEYAQEFGDEVIQVWVNPGRDVLDLLEELLKGAPPSKPSKPEKATEEQLDEYQRSMDIYRQLMTDWMPQAEGFEGQMMELMGMLWECGADEVKELKERTRETDPGLVNWLSDASVRLLWAHRAGVRKN